MILANNCGKEEYFQIIEPVTICDQFNFLIISQLKHKRSGNLVGRYQSYKTPLPRREVEAAGITMFNLKLL
jgi:hypothetical protein